MAVRAITSIMAAALRETVRRNSASAFGSLGARRTMWGMRTLWLYPPAAAATATNLGRPQPDDVMTFEGVIVDLTRREIHVNGDTLELTALEFDLLAALASAPSRVFTRAQLLERVWGWDYFGAERVVDLHIGNLRKALGDDATDPRFIATVRGVGCEFVATPK